MVYILGIYVYIYNFSDKCRKESCGFNFFIKLKKKFNHFQNHTARTIFCKICLKVTMPTFWFFKSIDINMVYTIGNICIYIQNISVHKKFFVGLIFSSSWKNFLLFSKSLC